MLGELYTRFDAIVERHPVFKKETSGDCYMLACGVPEPHPRHGVDMVDAVSEVKLPRATSQQLRIGVHSGPVVGGVTGRGTMRTHFVRRAQ